MIKSRRKDGQGMYHTRVKKNAYSVFVEKPEGKRAAARPRCKWEDNIKRDLREK
jgi:hypothetical protein